MQRSRLEREEFIEKGSSKPDVEAGEQHQRHGERARHNGAHQQRERERLRVGLPGSKSRFDDTQVSIRKGLVVPQS